MYVCLGNHVEHNANSCKTGPFELIKLNAQLAGKMQREANPSDRPQPISDLRTGAFKTAQQLVRDRGIRGLYCGYRLHLGKFPPTHCLHFEQLFIQCHLVRDTVGTAIYFGTYETVKQMLSNARGNGSAEPAAVALAGATCGIVSWVMVCILKLMIMALLLINVQIYPIDVVKTQYQKRQLEMGASQVVRPPIKFFQPGSYRGKQTVIASARAPIDGKTGLGVSVGRSALINMIFFSSFEAIKKRINTAGDI